jgi:SHS family lactate transporter-like MFS transporter
MSKSHDVPDGHRAALLAGFLGWTFVAFDFFLVVATLTAIAREFHRPDKDIALSIALTLGFRPVGGPHFRIDFRSLRKKTTTHVCAGVLFGH